MNVFSCSSRFSTNSYRIVCSIIFSTDKSPKSKYVVFRENPMEKKYSNRHVLLLFTTVRFLVVWDRTTTWCGPILLTVYTANARQPFSVRPARNKNIVCAVVVVRQHGFFTVERQLHRSDNFVCSTISAYTVVRLLEQSLTRTPI